MYGLLGLDLLGLLIFGWDTTIKKNLESEGAKKKIKILRKSHLKLFKWSP